MAFSPLSFVGRLLLVLVFLGSAAHKLQTFDKETGGPTAAFMGPKLNAALEQFKSATGVEIPLKEAMYPHVILAAAALELVGGLLVLANIKAGAFFLILFLLPTSFIIHNFWELPADSPEQQNEMAHFLKNLSIMGGLIYFMCTGAAATKARRSKDKWD